MDLIIRLKRPRNVDPYEALVLASKRRKTEDGTKEITAETVAEPTILKFAGTLSHQDEDITPHIFKAKEHINLKTLNHLKSKDVICKLRSEAKRASKENRLKLVNMSRSISGTDFDHNYAAAGDCAQKRDKIPYTIVDVVHDSKEEPESESSCVEEDDKYVYSLYFANSAGGEFNDGFLDSLISVEPLESSAVNLYDYRVQNDDDLHADDEDDSNDENNWRNDYPDSDPDNEGQHSSGPFDLKMDQMKLDSENELSSDDEEDNLPYGVDHDQVLNLGKEYAHFKARVIKEMEDDELEEYSSEVQSSDCDELVM
ncbi:probable RNA polymerase II nuclear localization protein SLC7A6OS [Hetaerina americana]|uniref:probable RNA polymerase II nuclear localization protein SLC7A6OS n=1 Tax=Hetaerina americana TaxID=62018 RepID=UPI003A7F17AE